MDFVNQISMTDALGRELTPISGFKTGKYVGLFYFLWHGQHAADRVRNITELLKTNYADLFDASLDNQEVPYDSWCHYQEPLYGYYNSLDPWVMRKHIELFIHMGIDFLVMDFTNGIYYDKPLAILMDLLLEYQAAGFKVPQISFYVNVKPQELTERLYREVYTNPKYESLMFYGNGNKPMVISVPHMLSRELNEYFDVRASQWYRGDYPDTIFPYWEFYRVWHKYTDMVNVSFAQSGTSFSFSFESWDGPKHENWGRGYTTATKENGNVDAILRGDNFQEGWDAAMALDPDMIFITGWNEWVMQKMNLHVFFPDHFKDDFPCYTDNFNVEYSRDAEMTKIPTYKKGEDGTYAEEGYGDNYVMQIMENIRKFKGIPASNQATSGVYKAVSTKKTARDCDGFYAGTHYTQDAPRTFIREVQVTSDAQNLYFNVTTDTEIQIPDHPCTNWMNLFIGVKGSNQKAWNGFHYVVNRHLGERGTASVELFTGGDTMKVGEAGIYVDGCTMRYTVSRDLLGIANTDFEIFFKIADGVTDETNILDYYVSGEVFPIGRLGYVYKG